MTHVDDRPWHADPWDDPSLGDDDTTEVERRAGRRSVRRVLLVVTFVAMTAVVATGVVGLWYTGQVNPAGDPGDPITFTVNDSDTLQTVSERLEDMGLVERAWVFRYYVDHHGGLELTPGYYRLRPFDHMGKIGRAHV